MAFTRMDAGAKEDWAELQRATDKWQASLADRIKSLLAKLAEQREGMAIDQLQHSLQTATRAVHSGASEELIVAALCHDIGTSISYENHPAIAAEILRPYVGDDVYAIVRTHQDFQRSHYDERVGRDVAARLRYADEAWFPTAERFSDEWDQASFDPQYETFSLVYFSPLVDDMFAAPRRLRAEKPKHRASDRLPAFSGWLKRVKKICAGRRG